MSDPLDEIRETLDQLEAMGAEKSEKAGQSQMLQGFFLELRAMLADVVDLLERPAERVDLSPIVDAIKGIRMAPPQVSVNVEPTPVQVNVQPALVQVNVPQAKPPVVNIDSSPWKSLEITVDRERLGPDSPVYTIRKVS